MRLERERCKWPALPLPVALAGNFTIALLGITIAVAAFMGANAAYYAVVVDIVPQRSAPAIGIMDFAFALAGFLAQQSPVGSRTWVVRSRTASC